MVILFVSGYLGLGGVQRMITLLGEELSKSYEIYYYSVKKSDSFWDIKNKNHIFYGPSENIIDRLLYKTYRHMCVIAKKEYDINLIQSRFIGDLSSRINQNKIDTLVLTSAFQFAAIPILKRKYPSLKIISWIHETYQSLENITYYYRDYFNLGIKESTQVVCLVKENYDYFSKLNRHCSIIPNSISLDSHGQISDLQSPNISFTSRISFAFGIKGLDVLVNVSKLLLPKYKITFADGGSSDDELEFQRMINQNKVSNRIMMQGTLKGKDLLTHYLNSSVFISTSRSESFSLVILEAMSVGLPIIAFSTSGARYLLGNGKYGILVNQGNVEEFAQQCNRLMTNQILLMHYQRLSLQRAKDFELAKSMEKWNSLLGK